MTVLQQVYLYLAIAASAVLLLQFVLTLIGVGGDGADADLDISDSGSDSTDFDGDGGLRILSLRGIVSFFAVGGWAGFGLANTTIHVAWVIVISVVIGFAAMVGVAFIYKQISKLQYDGTQRLSNGIGKVAEVYLPIGANNSNVGKITLDIQGRFTEAEAVTEIDHSFKVGDRVKVSGMQTRTIFTVVPLYYEEKIDDGKAALVDDGKVTLVDDATTVAK